MNPHETKFCVGCRRAKPLVDFPIDRTCEDGHARQCVDCWAAVRNSRSRPAGPIPFAGKDPTERIRGAPRPPKPKLVPNLSSRQEPVERPPASVNVLYLSGDLYRLASAAAFVLDQMRPLT